MGCEGGVSLSIGAGTTDYWTCACAFKLAWEDMDWTIA